MAMASILWLTGQYFRPADSGMYRYSLDMSAALAELGHHITFIGRQRTEGEPSTHPDGWTLLKPRAPHILRKLLSTRHPVKVVEIWAKDYRQAVESAMSSMNPDLVVFDHLRVGAAIDYIGDTPCAYFSQNDEAMVRSKMIAEASGPKKAALKTDLIKLRNLENRLLRECSVVSAISEADVETFRKRGGAGKTVLALPVYKGQRLPARTIDDNTPRRVAIISTLFWDAKLDNLLEALEGLQPLIDSGVELTVFTGGYPPPLEIIAANPKVAFEGFVPDFQQALGNCRVGLVYEPLGGGFKMKTLDFIFHRVPLVVGAGSAAGLPLTAGQDLIEVADHHGLADAIGSIIDDTDRLNQLQQDAFEKCKDAFTVDSLWPLSEALDRAVS